ncbi:hypothetical protein [Halalkalicoccus tibetensis]|uniref:Transposase n=1 Tax=Halalkalicoccus tibetensis TaxID=175632 RepID=A0ABD5UXE6_9EURY
MTSVDEIRQTVLESASKDWDFHKSGFGMLETADYKHITWVNHEEVELRIERGRNVDWERESEWSGHEDAPIDAGYRYWVIYGRSPVSSHVLLSIDNYQATMAVPSPPEDAGPWTVSEYEDRLGAIVSGSDGEYEKRRRAAGIEVA